MFDTFNNVAGMAAVAPASAATSMTIRWVSFKLITLHHISANALTELGEAFLSDPFGDALFEAEEPNELNPNRHGGILDVSSARTRRGTEFHLRTPAADISAASRALASTVKTFVADKAAEVCSIQRCCILTF